MGQSNHQTANAFFEPDLFVASSKEHTIVARVQTHVRAALTNTYPDTNKLIQVITDEGLPVFQDCPDFQSKLLLMTLGGKPGFVSPTFEHYARLVQFLSKHMANGASIDFSNGFFFLLKDVNHYGALAYEYYHWQAYRHGLGGYETEARKLYDLFNRKHHGQLTPQLLNKLNSQQASLLRLAIRRDKEALTFIRLVRHEVFTPANNAKRLESGEITQA